MSIYKGTQLISGVATPIEPTRNIGQIIPSLLPLTDAGLHLLDGEVVVGNGMYKAFVEYISKLDLTASYFTTEANWQATVEQYGVCGKFVYDASANTVRLPKVTGHIEGTLDANALGDLVEAGLPNITGSVTGSVTVADSSSSGALKFTRTGACSVDGSNHNQGTLSVNASDSNSIYKDDVTTVQTQSILGYMYIVVATGTKTDIEVDIDNVATDLNQKVNKNDMALTPVIIEVSDKSLMPSWYRVYSDGWCEQGGNYTGSDNLAITLLKQYRDGDYNFVISGVALIKNQTTTGFTIDTNYGYATKTNGYWQAKGYIK